MAHGDNRWIQTYTGRPFWPLDPRPEDVFIEDIAHALAVQCRFGGHCRWFYSIAQHSVYVASIVEQREPVHYLTALLHDAAEAYTADICRPIKKAMFQFAEVEAGIMKVIAERYHLTYPFPQIVKTADDVMLATEKRDLMVESTLTWTSLDGVKCLQTRVVPVDWTVAESQFLQAFMEYDHGAV